MFYKYLTPKDLLEVFAYRPPSSDCSKAIILISSLKSFVYPLHQFCHTQVFHSYEFYPKSINVSWTTFEQSYHLSDKNGLFTHIRMVCLPNSLILGYIPSTIDHWGWVEPLKFRRLSCPILSLRLRPWIHGLLHICTGCLHMKSITCSEKQVYFQTCGYQSHFSMVTPSIASWFSIFVPVSGCCAEKYFPVLLWKVINIFFQIFRRRKRLP